MAARQKGRREGSRGVEATASVVVPLAVVGRVDRSGFSGGERKRETEGDWNVEGSGPPPA